MLVPFFPAIKPLAEVILAHAVYAILISYGRLRQPVQR